MVKPPIPGRATAGRTVTARPSAPRRFASGVGLLLAGFRMWGTSPRLMFLGVVPALIVGAVFLTGIIVLAINIGSAATWVTPFAADYAEPWRTTVRALAGGGIAVGAVLIAVHTFAAVTLAVGEPFYERIWRRVEAELGDPPADRDESMVRGAVRGIADGVRLLLVAAGIGVALFILGFFPVVGQTIVPVIGALTGGWLLATELTAFAFDARGFSLRERRAILRGDRATALGFGAATYLLFLVPILAVVVMPAAVSGAALLSRRLLDGMATPAPG